MTEVIKRDGTIVDFDVEKIRNAILAANPSKDIEEVVEEVCERIDRASYVHVEAIQDLVESHLISVDYDAGRRFILYRESRRMDSGVDTISDYIHASKYSRDGETFEQTVDRRKQMDLDRWPELAEDIETAYKWVYEKKVLPAMRSMQFAGDPIRAHNARMYNCSFTLLDRLEAFSEGLYLLLCGCGVGYSVQSRHVNLLPDLHEQTIVRHTQVEDTIEGWADALRALLEGAASGVYVEFDYSLILPRGAELKTSGGKAPGHIPLKRALEKIRTLLTPGPWTPLQAHRVMCIAAEAVLAGGIRRSSLNCLFDLNDTQMMSCKTGKWYEEMPELAMANNSAVFHRSHDVDHQAFERLFENMKEFGEPGFFFTENYDWGTNPCFEIGLNPKIDEKTGFAFCNLSEINAALVPDDQFFSACRAAAFINTLQAAWSDFRYLCPESKEIAERDALLGIGITGQAERRYSSELLQAGVREIIQMNQETADKINIRPARSVTCVKPSGTTSLLLGCVGSGVHPHPAKKYIRRVTANPLESAFQFFKEYNPHMCREKPNGDWVIEFPISTDGATVNDEFEFIDEVFRVYENWVAPGQVRSGPRHNVSCTVSVTNWDDIPQYIWKNRYLITAMSFLPVVSGYDFMPFEPVDSPAQIAYWQKLRGNPVPWELFDGSGSRDLGGACEGPVCEF